MNFRLIRVFGVAAGLFSLCSCAALPRSAEKRAPALARFRLDVEDHRSDRKFVLTLTSLDDRPLRMFVYDWPMGGGMHFGSERVALESEKGRYPAIVRNFGYIIAARPEMGRNIPIPPGGKLVGVIGYGTFGDPEVIVRLRVRKLRFQSAVSVRD